MRVLHGDFETRSAVDLKACGADVYARHDSTDILCFAYAFDDGPVELIRLGDPLPNEIKLHLLDGGIFVAHNAAFELAIWNYVCARKYNWPKLKPEQCRCTMVMAYAMAIPGSLEKSAAAMGIDQQKDLAGQRVMMQLSQPKEVLQCEDGTPFYHWFTDPEHPEKFEKLYEYCKQDIRVEQELFKRLMKLSPSEQKLWEIDQRINQRGVYVDLPAVEAAIKLVEGEKVRLDQAMREATENQVATCTASTQLKKWIISEGFETEGVAKAHVDELLKNPALPEKIKKAVLLRQEAAKSSTAKLVAMKDGACADSRIRGLFQYHGASTGRWAGRRIQPQNFPRSKLDQTFINDFLDQLPLGIDADEISLFYGSPMGVISEGLRGFLTAAPGHELLAADYSAIEARVLAWLAGEEDVLEIFRTHGKIYEHAAAMIFGVPMEEVTKEQRQIGKVAVLALGYEGGKGAFQMMAKAYGVKVSDREAEQIKNAWRLKRWKTVKFWRDLEAAAIAAVRYPGKKYAVGSITYLMNASFLFCQLPSKRVLCYPYPKVGEVELPWGEMKDGLSFMSENSVTRKFDREMGYGGKLAENVTQAVSRDVLAEGIIRAEERGAPVVLHVHDEIVSEVSEGSWKLEDFEALVAEQPKWAEGLPLSAEGWIGKRYRK
jgi:DNA polymerase